MRLLLLVILTLFVPSFAGANTKETGDATPVSDVAYNSSELSADQSQGKPSLRQHDFSELSTEDRLMREVVVKSLQTARKMSQDMYVAAKKALMRWEHIAEKYPAAYAELSKSTKNQLIKIQLNRPANIEKFKKTDGKSLHIDVEDFWGIERVPAKFTESRHGRENQRFTHAMMNGKKVKLKLSTAAVISRSKEQGGGDVLLISSSNPEKMDGWTLPRGGWEKGETVGIGALREVLEEGGVKAKLVRRLDFLSSSEKKAGYLPFMMKAEKVYDDWSENVRNRLWVSYDDALIILQGRPELVNVVKMAKKAKKANPSLKENPELAKIRLEGLD